MIQPDPVVVQSMLLLEFLWDLPSVQIRGFGGSWNIGVLFRFNDWFEGGELISLKASSGKMQLTFHHRSSLIFQMSSVSANILSCWCLVGSTQACLKTASIRFPVF